MEPDAAPQEHPGQDEATTAEEQDRRRKDREEGRCMHLNVKDASDRPVWLGTGFDRIPNSWQWPKP